MSREQRAKQFMPFDALRGYYALIKEKNKVVEEKKLLSQEVKDELSLKLSQIKKRDMIEIVYYDIDSYKNIVGLVSEIDYVYKKITIVKKTIRFDDILKINEKK